MENSRNPQKPKLATFLPSQYELMIHLPSFSWSLSRTFSQGVNHATADGQHRAVEILCVSSGPTFSVHPAKPFPPSGGSYLVSVQWPTSLLARTFGYGVCCTLAHLSDPPFVHPALSSWPVGAILSALGILLLHPCQVGSLLLISAITVALLWLVLHWRLLVLTAFLPLAQFATLASVCLFITYMIMWLVEILPLLLFLQPISFVLPLVVLTCMPCL